MPFYKVEKPIIFKGNRYEKDEVVEMPAKEAEKFSKGRVKEVKGKQKETKKEEKSEKK